MTLSPLEAYESLMRYARERGEGPLKLAMHAAVPQSFRPRLLHLMKLNFVAEFAGEGWLESDVLHAAFCSEMGGGYYQFDPQVRALLLDNLQADYDDGPARLRAVAAFLLAYLDEQERAIDTQDRLGTSYIEVQRWVALSILDPDATAQQLAAALNFAAAPGGAAARMRIGGLVKVLAAPLLRYPRLADYASGMAALERGDVGRARELLGGLGTAEVQVGAVKLRSGRTVLEEWKVGEAPARYPRCVLISALSQQVSALWNVLDWDLRNAGVYLTTVPSDTVADRDLIAESEVAIVLGSREMTAFSERAGEAVEYAVSRGKRLVAVSLDRSLGIVFRNTVAFDAQIDFQNWREEYDGAFRQLLDTLHEIGKQPAKPVAAPEFEYDILIARAELDDGWASQFQRDLQSRISEGLGREVRVGRWNIASEKIPSAAVLVVIFSYAVSVRQCEQAVDRFQRAGSRIVLATLRKLEPLVTPAPFRSMAYTEFFRLTPAGDSQVVSANTSEYQFEFTRVALRIAAALRPDAESAAAPAPPVNFVGRSLALGNNQVYAAMEILSVPAAVIWALLDVETSGCGFLPDRRPMMRFEGPMFTKLTRGRFQSPEKLEGSVFADYEYARLSMAMSLDRSAALQSGSWGLGQILGRNYEPAGYPDVEQFVAAMTDSEDAQFSALVRFVKSRGLEKHLQNRDWDAFRRSYSGHGRSPMGRAVEKYLKGTIPDLSVRAAQLYLTYAGEDPGGVDGILGKRTRAALERFQRARGLPVSGEPDPRTMEALIPRPVGPGSAA